MANDLLVAQFKRSSRYGQVHLDFFNGQMAPTVWDDGGGPDSFEVEVGNRVAYAVPLTEAGAHFCELQSRWLPYYENDLRLSRLAMVREACALDLERVSFFVSRSLYFAAFDHCTTRSESSCRPSSSRARLIPWRITNGCVCR
jgi:hypothetical protein